LTETYLSLRRLENEIIRELYGLGAQCSIRVSIENFYGIEINDFAVAVARTAMWIAENQMLQETEMIIHEDINFLPLTSAAHIVEGNALRLDWHEIAPRGVDYVIGNPPFVGNRYQTAQQRADVLSVCKELKPLDYVTCWFKRAADFMVGNRTRAALVATNSITQGEQVAPLWKVLDAHIDFARRTFKWLSESEDMAAVHCVIVGFSHAPNDRPKIIYDGDKKLVAKNINGYLLDGPNILIDSRTKPICDVPKMRRGNQATDGGNLIIEADDYAQFIRREPRAQKFIRRLIGAEEFLNGKARWCLWLVDATADDLQLPLITQRVEGCRQTRLKSRDAGARKLAATPHLFREQLNPPTAILVPRVSSENRKYIPMGFIDDEAIVTDRVQIIPNADLFHFGVLESSTHMAWTSVVCGRLEMRYNYSAHVVYNNFPWCGRTVEIEQTAQRILDARALYSSWTLAALYDPNLMPLELRAAHEANDRAVMSAYGFAPSLSESEIVSSLMSMYQRLTQ
ncbi:MAG: SAM-dependent DNA methyltransferase, partial [Selenomonadaceae bacterium]|nr:SAM-dependent DNA methyltransferase [Selenomonadaceae bacterium]